MNRYNKASLFLMELIIALLFFSIASAVCIQVFVKAHTMNEKSIEKNNASIIASNIAETYRSEQLDQFYKVDSNNLLYFDQDWNLVSPSLYTYKAHLKEDNNVLSIQIYHDNQLILSLECMQYNQRKFEKDVI